MELSRFWSALVRSLGICLLAVLTYFSFAPFVSAEEALCWGECDAQHNCARPSKCGCFSYKCGSY